MTIPYIKPKTIIDTRLTTQGLDCSRRRFLRTHAGTALLGSATKLVEGAAREQRSSSFADRLLPAPVGGGFALPDYWVWCGSVIKGPDDKYHMFASRWPRNLAFAPHWLTNSEIVRATSTRPEGPYKFEEVIFAPRGSQYWDGRMTHNPTIHKYKDMYLLYYIGTTYEGITPTPAAPERQGSPKILEARAGQRIGLAVAKSPAGPWKRPDQPILLPRPGKWDALMTTNPAPCVLGDGRTLLIYKSTAHQKDLLRLGVAAASRFDGSYERRSDEPIFNFDKTGDHVEDAYVWHQGHQFQLIMKDMQGGISGEKGAGIHATSPDGVKWMISNPPLAYSRQVRWTDGTTTTQGHLERPQLLMQNGRPTHLFLATGDGPGGFNRMTRTWNMVIPLR